MGAGASVPESEEAALSAGYTPEQIELYKNSLNLPAVAAFEPTEHCDEPDEPDMDDEPPELPPEFYEKQEQLKSVAGSLGADKFQLDDKTVSVKELVASPNKFHVLDARSNEEIQVSKIPNAHTRGSFDMHPEDFKDKPVVVYCTVGYIGGGCVRELINKGHENVNTLGDGALLGYTLYQTALGVDKPLVKPDGTPTNQVHTFTPDLAPLAGEGMETTYFEDPTAELNLFNRNIRRALHGWGDFWYEEDGAAS